jgi:hypothetical protein
MPINDDHLAFLMARISTSGTSSFASTIKHLLEYLKKECANNKKYLYYEDARSKWANWPAAGGGLGGGWQLPDNIEDTKTLSYDLYCSAAEQNDEGNAITLTLFNKSLLEDNIYRFNLQFFPYLELILQEITKSD